ncbi:MAG: ferrous iron transport protein B [Anaerolineales bacterium]
MRNIHIAIAGNPNAGKSTLFNALTGSHQHVGNWPGKTVKKKVGRCKHGDYPMKVVDLPGTYSLSAFSPEEVIARDYILDQQPDVVVIVLDSANLERNLYLAVQTLELGVPIVAALNMSDIVDAQGIKIDYEHLEKALQSPVVRTVASKGEGIEQLIETIIDLAEGQSVQSPDQKEPFSINYGGEAEAEIQRVEERIIQNSAVPAHLPERWLAIKLLEEDEELWKRMEGVEGGPRLLEETQRGIDRLEKLYGDDLDITFAERRYGWIAGLVQRAVKRTVSNRMSTSDKVDRIVTHRILGIPIFLIAMWVVFQLTVNISGPYVDWVDGVISGPLTSWIEALIGRVGFGGTWLEGLFLDGIIPGVGGVLVFIPVLMFLYFALAILEDSGYMARAAFVMDRLMHIMGLHGKSFLPMLVGFGCTVPAIYATRTLENKNDRILTGLLVPFMSCGARLPVYVLMASVFFPSNAGLVIFGMYSLGIVTAIILGVILKHTLFKGKEQSTFVMELPPYRLPTLRGIWFHMWKRTSAFLRKAWTVIMVVSIVLWVLISIPMAEGGLFAETEVGDSLFAAVNRQIAPIFGPLGFESWETSSALITGFLAKEVVIGTMSQVYAVEKGVEGIQSTSFFEDLGTIVTGFVDATMDAVKSLPLIMGINLFEEEEKPEPTALMNAIRMNFEASSGGHGALAGLSFMVFVLIYTPCMVAVAAERQELGPKWMWVSILGQTILAWLMALIIFQGGKLLGFG